MTTRPPGYREPTEAEMQCLPEGALYWHESLEEWSPSGLIGNIACSRSTYVIPETTAVPSLDPLASQVGGTHYKGYAIQPAEFITRNNLPFLEGCVIKRVCRHRDKNGAEDIRKAIHELQLILKLQYGEDAEPPKKGGGE